MLTPRALPFLALGALALGAGTCSVAFAPGNTLTLGTWGGEDAGLIVTDFNAHVHFGCTAGDFPAPIKLDENGRFSVSGAYVIDLYPVATGPSFPAELAGVARGRDLTMTVAVNDTINDRLVVFGPTTVRLGRQPDMQICPICEVPPASEAARPGVGSRLEAAATRSPTEEA